VEPSLAPGSEPGEEGEDMDAVNDDDAAMMAAMGLAGFGSTKVRLLIFDMAIFQHYFRESRWMETRMVVRILKRYVHGVNI
jgi:hypothetical protein